MKSPHNRNREELESVLKRVARMYAMGEIPKESLDEFAETMESAFFQINTMEEEDADGQA